MIKSILLSLILPHQDKNDIEEWIDKIMHKKFHIGWVFLVLSIGIITCITILVKIT